ncbi:hypothetical protein DOTSEDRAFT_57293 [Dothistroma septosporum NZE10]|uniref:PARP catalytic domain-containing protein n=1 Tax=Dothistroma septosporum (strain NZE10 / CBS 128990) TaxID=675120 RepID=M2WJ42_DOTSN|nr:hypothetical protein DOTSEDRAFT_57293 [Dothistroma septosporum NZE10]
MALPEPKLDNRQCRHAPSRSPNNTWPCAGVLPTDEDVISGSITICSSWSHESMDALNTYAFEASRGAVSLAVTAGTSLKTRSTAPKRFWRKYTPEEWRKDIDSTANGLLPADTGGIFPWTQLRVHTDTYLAKQKTTPNEVDSVLQGLIDGHLNKVVAIAACSHRMSRAALLVVLQGISKWLTGPYCQAVVAASQCSNDVSFVSDGRWAALLIQTDKEVASPTLSPSTVDALLGKWCSPSLPVEPGLYAHAIALTTTVLDKLYTSFELFRMWEDWTAAIPLATVLSRLHDRPEGISIALKESLDINLSDWRSWACWQPHQDRMERWQAFRGAGYEHIDTCWTLLGPDFDSLGGIYDEVAPSARSYHTTNGTFTQWLESHGLMPGPGIVVAVPKKLRRFSDNLFRVIDLACCDVRGTAAMLFLKHLCTDKRLGLDDHSLHLFELCQQELFIQGQAFLVELLEDHGAPLAPRYVTSNLRKGLRILNRDTYDELRSYLDSRIQNFVKRGFQALKSHYIDELPDNDDVQAPNANAIAEYQALLAQSPWLNVADMRTLSLDGQNVTWSSCLVAFSGLYSGIRGRNSPSMKTMAIKYIDSFIDDATTVDDDFALMYSLHSLWVRSTSGPRRSAALPLACALDLDITARIGCVKDLEKLPETTALAMITLFVRPTDVSTPDMCRKTVAVASDAIRHSNKHKDCWQALVRYAMGRFLVSPQYMLHLRIFTDCHFITYQHWVKNLQTIFDDTIDHLSAAVAWTDKLQGHKSTLNDLYAVANSAASIHCIYTSFDRPGVGDVLTVIDHVAQEKRKERRTAMVHILLSLTSTEKYALSTLKGVQMISSASQPCFEQCQKLLDLASTHSLYVAAVQLNVWIASSSLDHTTVKALSCLAETLHFPPAAKADLAKDYFLGRMAELMERATRLEASKAQLKCIDKDGVTALLLRLKIEDTSSALDDEIAGLPNDMINMVEQVDANTFELQFPLSHLKVLQRKAMGLTQNESLIVRLTRAPSGAWESFCVHTVDPQTDWHTIKHSPMKLSQSTPHRLPCEGRDTRIGYTIMRSGWKWLVSNKGINKTSIAVIYRNVERVMKMFGTKCIVCDQSLHADLYRPTTCAANGCWATWIQSSLEVRLADLRLDESVVELLLAAVQASTTRMSLKRTINLLPTRPFRLNDDKLLLNLTDRIPAITTAVKTLDDLYQIQGRYSIRGELLLSWLCNGFKGFLASASSGPLRIPNLPNVLQYVVVDSPPSIAAAFAQHDHLQPRQVLFHGTSMDRLWPILCEGLKILSSTSFQTHGAAYGSGIYLAESPATAVGYASQVLCQQPTFAANHSPYVNKKVLLGIEYAGDDALRGNGIHVATDPSKLLLRYVFLLPEGFRAPIANHVVPAMLSNFSTLRNGARKT